MAIIHQTPVLNQETDSFAIALSQTWTRPWFLKHWGPAHDCSRQQDIHSDFSLSPQISVTMEP